MIKKAFFEAVFVVFGVVLALGANEWRRIESDKARAALAMTGIRAELAANLRAIEAARVYHREKLAGLRRSDAAVGLEFFDRGFIAPAALSDAAWRSASETGVLSRLPFETVLAFGRVYDRQAAYDEQSRASGRLIYGAIFDGGTAAVLEKRAGLASMISALTFTEDRLVKAYDEVLEG